MSASLRDRLDCARAVAGYFYRQLVATEAERDRLRAQLTAMKLRALAAHEAVWRAMHLSPEGLAAAIGDHGLVHEAIHEILRVDTDPVTVPAEWVAHLERQDRRIEHLEAERARYESVFYKAADLAHERGNRLAEAEAHGYKRGAAEMRERVAAEIEARATSERITAQRWTGADHEASDAVNVLHARERASQHRTAASALAETAARVRDLPLTTIERSAP